MNHFQPPNFQAEILASNPKLDKNDIAQAISIAEKLRIRILDWIKQELGGGTLANSKAVIQEAVLLQANTPTGQVHKKTLLLMSIVRILRDNNKTYTHVDLARQLGYRANHAVFCATIKKLTKYGLIHKVPYGYQIDSEFNLYHNVLLSEDDGCTLPILPTT